MNDSFEWLERAYKQRDGGLAEIKGEPLLHRLKGDPRYFGEMKEVSITTFTAHADNETPYTFCY